MKSHWLSDNDRVGSIDDWKSTSGYAFFLGTKKISWSLRKQKTVALSSTETELIATTSVVCEGM